MKNSGNIYIYFNGNHFYVFHTCIDPGKLWTQYLTQTKYGTNWYVLRPYGKQST